MATDYFRNSLWCLIRELKTLESLYSAHKQKSVFYSNLIAGFLCITSVSGVISFFSNLPSWIWGSIVFASSILSATNHLFPYNKRADKISLILPELDLLINSVLSVWYSEESMTNTEVIKYITEFRNERSKLESKYMGDEGIPHKVKMFEKAQEEADNFLKYTLTFECEEIENVGTEKEPATK